VFTRVTRPVIGPEWSCVMWDDAAESREVMAEARALREAVTVV